MKKILFIFVSLLVLLSTFSLALDPVDVKITGSASIQANTLFEMTISLDSKNQRVQNFDFYVKSQNGNVVFSNGQRTGSDHWFPSRTPLPNQAEENGAVWHFKIPTGTDSDPKLSTTDKQVFVLRGVATTSDSIMIDTSRSVVNRLFSQRDTDKTPIFQLSATALSVTVEAPCISVLATACVGGVACPGNTVVAPIGCPTGQSCNTDNVCVATEVPCTSVPATACVGGVACPGNTVVPATGCPDGQVCNVANTCQTTQQSCPDGEVLVNNVCQLTAAPTKSQQLNQQIQAAVAENQGAIDSSSAPPVGFLTRLMSIIRSLWSVQ
ncbi:TPA: hypothetical protein HA241_00210 [Candidatus Woesearchaeota archaeon]|nr:hypothetical protein [Candidatus Woesearchaeota archaeon]